MQARDREILRLAVPAFGALVAEPAYVLVDTAIVGRLGTLPLGGLAVAGAALTAAFGVFNFLAYGTTAAVARHFGAGDERTAAEHGIAGLWLALGLGISLTAVGLALAPAIVDAMGASARVRPHALTYLRIGLLGAAPLLCTLAATGYLRGLQDTRTPFAIAVAANAANLVLDLVLIYGLDLGLAGSAWATVVAQAAGAVAILGVVARRARAAHAPARPRRAHVRGALVVGGQLTVRTASLLAVFTAATAIASRIGDDEVAAHQVAWQIWLFLALALDAIAIAGQAIVGRTLGSGDAAGTRARARRMVEWGVLAGLLAAAAVIALRPLLASAFSDDPAVRDHLLVVLWAVAGMQPLAAIVFVLDGVLIGAGESRYLAVAMVAAAAAFVPAAALVVAAGGGLVALWGALYVFMAARLGGVLARFRSDAWLVVGATRA
ncbi:MAG: MATE family efflux transporter [Acidimicrobiia bacterium]|nr:MAG: MATE family efflux transporter [Acidimicrobiia bacterium]